MIIATPSENDAFGSPAHAISRVCSGQEKDEAKYQCLHFFHLLEAQEGSVRDHLFRPQAPRGINLPAQKADRVLLSKEVSLLFGLNTFSISVISPFRHWKQSIGVEVAF